MILCLSLLFPYCWVRFPNDCVSLVLTCVQLLFIINLTSEYSCRNKLQFRRNRYDIEVVQACFCHVSITNLTLKEMGGHMIWIWCLKGFEMVCNKNRKIVSIYLWTMTQSVCWMYAERSWWRRGIMMSLALRRCLHLACYFFMWLFFILLRWKHNMWRKKSPL